MPPVRASDSGQCQHPVTPGDGGHRDPLRQQAGIRSPEGFGLVEARNRYPSHAVRKDGGIENLQVDPAADLSHQFGQVPRAGSPDGWA